MDNYPILKTDDMFATLGGGEEEQAQLLETASEHANSAPVRTDIVDSGSVDVVDSGSEDIPLRYPRRMRREPIRFKGRKCFI